MTHGEGPGPVSRKFVCPAPGPSRVLQQGNIICMFIARTTLPFPRGNVPAADTGTIGCPLIATFM